MKNLAGTFRFGQGDDRCEPKRDNFHANRNDNNTERYGNAPKSKDYRADTNDNSIDSYDNVPKSDDINVNTNRKNTDK